MQTSGEIGRFYIDPESEGVKLGSRTLQPVKHSMAPQFNLGTSLPEPALSGTLAHQDTARNPASSRPNSDTNNRRHCANSGRNELQSSGRAGSVDRTQYLATLQKLDRTFSNSDRRDLYAASIPSRPAHELVWCAANNSRGAQASKVWAEKLRRDPSSQT